MNNNTNNYYGQTHQIQQHQQLVQGTFNPPPQQTQQSGPQQLQDMQAQMLRADYSRKQQIQQLPINMHTQGAMRASTPSGAPQSSSRSSSVAPGHGTPGGGNTISLNGNIGRPSSASPYGANFHGTPQGSTAHLLQQQQEQHQQQQFAMYNAQYQARALSQGQGQVNGSVPGQMMQPPQQHTSRPATAAGRENGSMNPSMNGAVFQTPRQQPPSIHPMHTPQHLQQTPTPPHFGHGHNQSISIAQMRRGASSSLPSNGPGSSSPMVRSTSGSLPPSGLANEYNPQGIHLQPSMPNFNGTPNIARNNVGLASVAGNGPPLTMLQQQEQIKAATLSNGAPMHQQNGIRRPGVGNIPPAPEGYRNGLQPSLNHQDPLLSGKMLPPSGMRMSMPPVNGVPTNQLQNSTGLPPQQPFMPPPPPPSMVQGLSHVPSAPPGHNGVVPSRSNLGHPQGSQPPPGFPVPPTSNIPPTQVPPPHPSSLLHQLAQIQSEAGRALRSGPPPSVIIPNSGGPRPPDAETGPNQGPRFNLNPAQVKQTLAQIHSSLINVDQGVTRIRPLPSPSDPDDVTHGDALPVLSTADIDHVKDLMAKDEAYKAAWLDSRERMDIELAEEVGGSIKWWERDATAEERRLRLEIVWPHEGRKLREKRKERKEIKLPKPSRAAARRPEELVPIRIEIEHEHQRLRETFVWNLNDPVVTPEVFAQTTCDDLDLPGPFVSQFVAQVKQQLSEYSSHKLEFPTPMDIDDDPVKQAAATIRGKLDEDDEVWWSRWRKRLRVDEEGSFVGFKTAGGDDTVDDDDGDDEDRRKRRSVVVPSSAKKPKEEDDNRIDVDAQEDAINHELRILIKIDITVGSVNLADQFEWDANDPLNSPEMFAEVYCKDLGLAGEFKTAIAHDIREQVQMYQKSLAIIGHPYDGTAIQDEDLKASFLPVVTSAARDVEQADNFTPSLHHLSETEMERIEKEREKEIKRKKRQGRARTKIVLPDRDAPKTQRTMPGATEVHNGMPPPTTVTIGSQRRAAAAAASATIASLAASENSDRPYGTMFTPVVHMDRHAATPPSMPPPSSTSNNHNNNNNSSKSKRQKTVHLRAPTLPDEVYGPRAKLSLAKPTPSTSLRPHAPPKSSRARGEGEGSSQQRTSSATPTKPATTRAPTAKEINDAKIKEYAEGLHPCMINGLWHCSVCGCPEDIAVGRRKGPLGEKTMCGDCGKFYHRHRRPNDAVEYNTDPEFHLAKRRAADEAKRSKKKPTSTRMQAALLAEAPIMVVGHLPQVPTGTPADDDEDEDDEEEEDIPLAARNRSKQPSVNRILSPELSDLDSVKAGSVEPPPPPPPQVLPPEPVVEAIKIELPPPPPVVVAQQVTVNGETPRPPSVQSSPTFAAPKPPVRKVGAVQRVLCPPGTPQWLRECLESTKAVHPTDDFGAIIRPPAAGAVVDPNAPIEWRIKCYDCPGKLYTPGPEQTLENFVVHLRNRNHRANVHRRLTQTVDGHPPEQPAV